MTDAHLEVASEATFLAAISALHPRSPLEHRPRINIRMPNGSFSQVGGVIPFFSPYPSPRNSSEFAATTTTSQLGTEMESFFCKFSEDARRTIGTVLIRTIHERYGEFPPATYARCDLVEPLERVVADLHMRWAPDSSNHTLGLARALLWFFFDIYSYPGIQVLLDHQVSPSVVRALIERDPVFSDDPKRSTRQVNLEHICRTLSTFHFGDIFEMLAEESILQSWTTRLNDPRPPFDHADIRNARALLREYAIGEKKLFNSIDAKSRQRLIDLGFIVCAKDRDQLELKQAGVDRDWLTELLTRVFVSSTDVARGHASNGRRCSTASDLHDTVTACSLLCYNSCGTGDEVIDSFAQQCRFVHANPFGPWTPSGTMSGESAGRANIFLIRSAHLSTISHLATTLRTMYSDGTEGAPYYARVGSHERSRREPPRLVIELDPMFSSELLVWLESYRVGLKRAKPDTVFHCIVSDQNYDPYLVINDPLASPRDSFAAIMATGQAHAARAEGYESTRALIAEWIKGHSKTTPEAAALGITPEESVGGWLAVRRANIDLFDSSCLRHDRVGIYSSALEAHEDRWKLALYIFTRSTAGEIWVVTDNCDELLNRLLGVLPVAVTEA